MPRSRKKKQYDAVVGLVGAANVPKKAALAHLSDFIEAQDGEILWVLPDTADITKTLSHVRDFLWNEEATIAVVSDGTADDSDEWIEAAVSAVEVDNDRDIYETLVTEVAGYDADLLAVVFALDEDHEADIDLLEAASKEDLTCYDLTSGLTELDLEEVDDDAAEEEVAPEPPEDEPEEKPEVIDRLPAQIQKMIEKGKFADAGQKMAEKFDSADIKAMAKELDLEFPKGTWAKNIATGIAEHLGDGPAEEPEEEEEAPKKPRKSTAAKKSTRRRATAPDEDDDGDDEPEVAADDEPVNMAAPSPQATSEIELRYQIEVMHAAAGVTANKGAAEAEKFLKLLRKESLL